MSGRKTKRVGVLLAVLWPAVFTTAFAHTSSLPHTHPHISIATQLTEVQKGTFDGRDYLTVHIGGHDVGPSSCRSNVLRIDTSNDSSLGDRREQIEAVALSAMLSAETVVIVIPLDITQCVDGKPTFTDLYRLSATP